MSKSYESTLDGTGRGRAWHAVHFIRRLLLGCVLSPAMASAGLAVDGSWNVNSSTNWSVAGSWLNGQIADGDGAVATFGFNISTTRTVTLNTVRTVGTLNFSDDGGLGHAWVLAGSNALTLANGGDSPMIDTLTNVRVSAPLLGTAGFTKTGAQELRLTGANNYSGGTTIAAGTLAVGEGGTIGTLGAGNVLNNGTLIIQRSNLYTLDQQITGTGHLIQRGSGTTVLTGANLYSGTTNVETGTLQVGNGGTSGALGTGAVTLAAGTALVFDRSDELTVAAPIYGAANLFQRGTGKTVVTATANFASAYFERGTFEVQAGSRMQSSLGRVGALASSSAAVGVTGLDARWTVDTLELGYATSAPGTLSVSSGGKVFADAVDVGIGSAGFATVSGAGSELRADTLLRIGFAGSNAQGTGSLTVTDGGKAQTNHLRVGQQAVGSVVISGSGSLLAVSNTLELRRGSLSLADGAAATSNLGLVGTLNTATAAITGTGTQWTVANQFSVAAASTGHLLIGDGGRLSSSVSYIGRDDSTLGSAVVDGADSLWTTTGNFSVGRAGQGSLLVDHGGRVVSGSGTIAHFAGSTGTATIAGDGSRWTLTDGLYVGGNETTAGGAGTLAVVGAGAAVEVGGLTKVRAGTGSLSLSDGGRLSTGVFEGDAAVNGILEIGRFDASSGYGGTLSGTGLLRKIGAGTLTLSNTADAELGSLQIDAGILSIASGGRVEVAGLTTIASAGELHVANGATFVSQAIEVLAGGRFLGAVETLGDSVVNGRLEGSVVVQAGAVLGGSGVVGGMLGGPGTVGPGNSPGVLDAAQIDADSGIDFLFEFTAANALPDYLNRTASLNDVLHLTHESTPFLAALTAANTITVDFQVASLTDGDVFYGGFFTNVPDVDFFGDGTVSGADYSFLLNGSPLDAEAWSVTVSTVAQPNTDFGFDYGGVVDGRVMTFQVSQVNAVPEPSSLILAGVVAAGYVARRRRKRATDW